MAEAAHEDLARLRAEVKALDDEMRQAWREWARSAKGADKKAGAERVKAAATKFDEAKRRAKHLAEELGVRELSSSERRDEIEYRRQITLLDIMPRRETIEVSDGFDDGLVLELTAITAMDAAQIVHRYPQLLKVLWGLKLTPEEAMALPDAIARAIAASSGHAGEEEWIAAAHRLSYGDQLRAIEMIIDLSVAKDGFGPFVNRVLALVGLIEPGPGKDPDSGTLTSSATRMNGQASGSSASVN